MLYRTRLVVPPFTIPDLLLRALPFRICCSVFCCSAFCLSVFYRSLLHGHCKYADDNTPYATANDIDSLTASLEEASKSLFIWFDNNLIKSNSDKCHLLVSSNEKVTIKIGSHEIANTKRGKLLGVHLASGLSFDYNISKICTKASHKACALARVTLGMSLSKKHTLMNAFFNSQFNYCPLIWMCYSRENNNKINRLHERCLRIIYNGKRSSFNTLLEKDGSVLIYERYIKILATKMFKVSKNIAPPQMHEISN